AGHAVPDANTAPGQEPAVACQAFHARRGRVAEQVPRGAGPKRRPVGRWLFPTSWSYPRCRSGQGLRTSPLSTDFGHESPDRPNAFRGVIDRTLRTTRVRCITNEPP